jgi:hypothetical protein
MTQVCHVEKTEWKASSFTVIYFRLRVTQFEDRTDIKDEGERSTARLKNKIRREFNELHSKLLCVNKIKSTKKLHRTYYIIQ